MSEAYSVLSDPQKKALYDSGKDPNDPGGGHGGFDGSLARFSSINIS